VGWYEDAVSGKYDAVDRDGLTNAIDDVCHHHTAAGIVVGKLDRLARALTVQEAILALVWRDGGQVFAAD
jgi:DNA invertase Pin-like site-specific DNA recombinase